MNTILKALIFIAVFGQALCLSSDEVKKALMAKHCTNKQNKRIFCDEKSLKTTMKSKDNQYMLKSFIPAKSLSKDDINYKTISKIPDAYKGYEKRCESPFARSVRLMGKLYDEATGKAGRDVEIVQTPEFSQPTYISGLCNAMTGCQVEESVQWMYVYPKPYPDPKIELLPVVVNDGACGYKKFGK